jgi:cobalt transporter subunit CbtA
MLHRLLGVALLAGLAAGLASALVQLFWAVPIIFDAEVYEHFGGQLPPGGFEAAKLQMQADHAAALGEDAGIWRHGLTILANVLYGVGAALMIAGIFNLFSFAGLKRGLAWGLGGFLAFAAAPAIGLPPELPGTMAAELADRQAWWLCTVAATGIGILMIGYGQSWIFKSLGLILMVVPHAIGAPHPEVHDAVAPQSLIHSFIVASLATSAVFWLVVGTMAGVLAEKFGLAEHREQEVPAT